MKDKCCIFCTVNEDETFEAGRVLSGIARGIVRLEGDLGTGKTVFARGVAAGLGIEGYITSPTFNIVNVYEKDGLFFNHMDAYRITDEAMLYDIGFDEIIDEGYITVIEWADMIEDSINEGGFRVRIEYSGESNKRLISLDGPRESIEEFAGKLK
ncbi:MAG: tRNA (adenosine(37)-N6)-threonylcarbamoyltransferase complex ATPase subunit type 1 TsaE [Clostridia bacterium]|nr:tRNA (adenosine(37)-N6)-threonylcarbamoyltransferase complex ATPase subunit type 1 TsaE [Clostridia bacterium]MBN2882040.1 tRNA (adenosine(37)-N6)-threonylcarbamoyltransferase complex ATPase subunit type 1 TsaE [Clostridia bacterium]